MSEAFLEALSMALRLVKKTTSQQADNRVIYQDRTGHSVRMRDPR